MQIGGTNIIDFAKISDIPKFTTKIKNGDRKRTIKLILLKNSEVLNLNNYTVVVAAKKSDMNDIFNAVKIVDAKEGICEVEITEQMLALNIDLPCEIVLYGADGTVAGSSNFVINKIHSLRNEESIISSSEFTALTQALTDVTYLKSNLNNKLDKNSVLNMSNMGQDIKEAMTGGSVAVVGENSILETNIVNKQVSASKLNENITNGIFPFSSDTEYVDVKDGVLNFECYNSIYNNLYLEKVYRKCDLHADGSNIVTSIAIKSESEIICQLNVSNYNERYIIERIKLENLKNDNAEYYITINWDKYKVNDFSKKNFNATQTKFHVNTYKNTDIIQTILEENNKEFVDIQIPHEIFGVVGKELNIYFDNIIMCNNLNNYQVDVWCDEGQQLEECFRIIPSKPGDIGIRILVYKDFDKTNKIAEKLVLLKVSEAKKIQNKNIIFLGDSITDFNVYPPELKKLLGEGVNFVGTRGTEGSKHEGRGGWTANDYLTISNKGSVLNAFFNPTTQNFDFEYYFNQNNLSAVDVFVIELGINDVAQGYSLESIISNYNFMIDNISRFSPNTKIIIALTIPPAHSQDGFGAKNKANKTRWEQKKLNFDIMKEQILKYDYKSSRNIYLCPINVNLDTINNFPYSEVAVNSRNNTLVKRCTENVHPAESGFFQIADSFYYMLNYLL